MSRTRPFRQVDVFGTEAFGGNPVAVVLDGADLDEAAMQRIARWTYLSETTVVLPPSTPDADYRVRIVTPGGEEVALGSGELDAFGRRLGHPTPTGTRG